MTGVEAASRFPTPMIMSIFDGKGQTDHGTEEGVARRPWPIVSSRPASGFPASMS
jgi:hypothetical protein